MDQQRKKPDQSEDRPGKARAFAREETSESDPYDWAWRASQDFIAQACGVVAEQLEDSARALRKREAGR
jgi:hypothetical protein